MDLLREDARAAIAFVSAEARGEGRRHLDALDADALAAALAARRRRVAEVAPAGLAFAL